MERQKRQELIAKACASFKDPPLPEHIHAKTAPDIVDGKKVHPWRDYPPFFRTEHIKTHVFDAWLAAKREWERKKPHKYSSRKLG